VGFRLYCVVVCLLVPLTVKAIASGAGHYAAANSFLDGMSESCQASGMPCTSAQFGPFAETGMAAEYAEALSTLGLLSLRPREVGTQFVMGKYL
jgi:KR domain